MKTNYKTAQLMYNQYGSDDCYATIDCSGKTIRQIVKELCSKVDFCEDVKFKEFEKEIENEKGVVYCFDGIGLFIAKEESTVEELYNDWYEEYCQETSPESNGPLNDGQGMCWVVA